MPDSDPYLVPLDPTTKVRTIAQQDGLSPDLADDFLKVTGVESGRSHYSRNGQVKLSPADPKDGQRAVGFSQIKPATAKSVGVDNPYDETENIKAGLRYFAKGGDDPIRRRIAYFSGTNSAAARYYDRTGKIPKGGDFTGTSFDQYVSASGGKQAKPDPYLVEQGQPSTPQATDDPYLVPITKTQTGVEPQGDIVSALQKITDQVNRATQSISDVVASKPEPQRVKARPQVTSKVTEAPDASTLSPLKFAPDTLEGIEQQAGVNAIGRGAEQLSRNVSMQGMQIPQSHPDIKGQRITLKFKEPPTPEQINDEALRQLGGEGYVELGNRFKDETGGALLTNLQQSTTPTKEGSEYVVHVRPTQGVVDAINAYAVGGIKGLRSALDLQDVGRKNVARDVKSELDKGGIRADLNKSGAESMLSTAQFAQNLKDLAMLGAPSQDPSAQAIQNARAGLPATKTVTGEIADVPIGAATTILKSMALPLGHLAFPAQQAIEASNLGAGEAAKRAAMAAPLAVAGPIAKSVGMDALSPIEQQIGKRTLAAVGMGETAAASGASPGEIAKSAVTGAAFPAGRSEHKDPLPLDIAARENAILGIDKAQTVPDFEKVLADREASVNPLPSPRVVRTRDALRNVAPLDVSLKPPPFPRIPYPENLGVVGPTKPVIAAAPDGPKLNRWQHRDFGRVTESSNQDGVPTGRVRVLAQDGTEHVIKRPNGRGAGNQLAVPVREAAKTNQQIDEEVEAEANAPFRVIDRRTTVEPSTAAPAKAGSEPIPTSSVPTSGPKPPATPLEAPFEVKQAADSQAAAPAPSDLGREGKELSTQPAESRQLDRSLSREEATRQGKTVAVPSYLEPNPRTAEIAFSADRSPDNLYRGTQTERELDAILKSGQIASTSETARSLGKSEHEGLTFYSDRPNVSSSYIQRDGYLLEVDRAAVKGAKEQGAGEISTEEPVPTSAIKRVIRVGRDVDGPYAFDVTQEVLGQPSTPKVASPETLTAERSPVPESKSSISQEQTVLPGEESTAPLNRVPAAPAENLKERSFPKTLAASGRDSGSNLTYEPITNEGDRAVAKDIVSRQGTDKAIELLSGNKPDSTKTALGIELLDQLTQEAKAHEKSGNSEEAALKYAQAASVAGQTSEHLTTAGQEVQAASTAKRYTPEGALVEAARVTKSKNVPLTPEEAKSTIDIAQRVKDSEQRIAQLEESVSALRTRKAGGRSTPRAPRLERIDVYFDRVAKEAQARIQARTEKAKLEVTGPKGQRGSGVNPASIPLDIADYAVIGASKIAKGGVNFARWSAEMVKDLGEQVRPHLDQIFVASRKLIDEKKLQENTALDVRRVEKASRSTPKTGEHGPYASPGSLADALQQLNNERAVKRQAKSDLDRHFRQLERDAESHKLDAVLSLTRDSLLSARGVLKLLAGMGGKQVLDLSSRFIKAGIDIPGTGPRTVAAPSFGGLLRTIGGFKTEIGPAVKGALRGEPSKVMPNVHGGPTDNAIVNMTVGVMQRLYGGKEAAVRSWAYPEARENQARVFALNDRRNRLIKRSEVGQRTVDYLNGRVDFEGALNKRLASSLANQAADYEVQSKQIIPSMKDVRAKEMLASPTELLHSLALQSADKSVYAQPYQSETARRLGSAAQSSAGGKITQTIVLPFAKRPANNIADNLFGYTGLRIPKEAVKLVKSRINSQFDPAHVKAFNDAVGKGASGVAVMAVGAALNRKGILVSPLDKEHPGAIKVNGGYYNVSNVPVIGWLLGMGAAFNEDGAANAPKAFAKMILEHPLLRSAKDVSETAQELSQQGVGKATTKYAAQTLSRFVPAPVKIAAEASDTKERITPGILGPSKASIPGVRQTLDSYADKSRLSVINPLYSKPRAPKLKRLGESLRLK